MKTPAWWKCEHCGLELSRREVAQSGGHDCQSESDSDGWTDEDLGAECDEILEAAIRESR